MAAAGLRPEPRAGGRLLRSRPDAAAPVVGARARRLVPRARPDLAPAAPAGGGVAAPLRRARREPRGGAARRRGRAARPRRLQAGGAARARRRGDGAGAAAARLRRAAAPRRAAPRARRARLHRLGHAAGDRRGDRRRPRLRRRARHGLRGARRPLHRPRRAGAARRGQGRRACASSPRARASTSRSAPRTPTATPTSRSSRRSAIRWSSIPTASCGGSRRSAAGRCSSSATAPTRTRGGASRLRSSPPARRGSRSSSPRDPVDAEEGLGRLRALGFGEADARGALGALRRRRAPRQAEPRPRADPVARGARGLRPGGRAAAASRRATASSAGTARGAIGYLVLGRVVRAQLERRRRTRGSSSATGRSRPGCSATTSAGSPTAASSAS